MRQASLCCSRLGLVIWTKPSPAWNLCVCNSSSNVVLEFACASSTCKKCKDPILFFFYIYMYIYAFGRRFSSSFFSVQSASHTVQRIIIMHMRNTSMWTVLTISLNCYLHIQHDKKFPCHISFFLPSLLFQPERRVTYLCISFCFV